jgi:TMEM175 potassium channel family protein
MSKEANEGLGKTRMEAISDGVFAVAMTLMLADAVTKEGVGEWRVHWGEKGLLFLVTFGIASTYWIAHNNECRHIRETDRLVLWLNLLFVAAVAFVPASVNMLGASGVSDGEDAETYIVIYLLNLVLMGVFLELWFVSLWRKGISDKPGIRATMGHFLQKFSASLGIPRASGCG